MKVRQGRHLFRAMEAGEIKTVARKIALIFMRARPTRVAIAVPPKAFGRTVVPVIVGGGRADVPPPSPSSSVADEGVSIPPPDKASSLVCGFEPGTQIDVSADVHPLQPMGADVVEEPKGELKTTSSVVERGGFPSASGGASVSLGARQEDRDAPACPYHVADAAAGVGMGDSLAAATATSEFTPKDASGLPQVAGVKTSTKLIEDGVRAKARMQVEELTANNASLKEVSSEETVELCASPNVDGAPKNVSRPTEPLGNASKTMSAAAIEVAGKGPETAVEPAHVSPDATEGSTAVEDVPRSGGSTITIAASMESAPASLPAFKRALAVPVRTNVREDGGEEGEAHALAASAPKSTDIRPCEDEAAGASHTRAAGLHQLFHGAPTTVVPDGEYAEQPTASSTDEECVSAEAANGPVADLVVGELVTFFEVTTVEAKENGDAGASVVATSRWCEKDRVLVSAPVETRRAPIHDTENVAGRTRSVTLDEELIVPPANAERPDFSAGASAPLESKNVPGAPVKRYAADTMNEAAIAESLRVTGHMGSEASTIQADGTAPIWTIHQPHLGDMGAELPAEAGGFDAVMLPAVVEILCDTIDRRATADAASNTFRFPAGTAAGSAAVLTSTQTHLDKRRPQTVEVEEQLPSGTSGPAVEIGGGAAQGTKEEIQGTLDEDAPTLDAERSPQRVAVDLAATIDDEKRPAKKTKVSRVPTPAGWGWHNSGEPCSHAQNVENCDRAARAEGTVAQPFVPAAAESGEATEVSEEVEAPEKSPASDGTTVTEFRDGKAVPLPGVEGVVLEEAEDETVAVVRAGSVGDRITLAAVSLDAAAPEAGTKMPSSTPVPAPVLTAMAATGIQEPPSSNTETYYRSSYLAKLFRRDKLDRRPSRPVSAEIYIPETTGELCIKSLTADYPVHPGSVMPGGIQVSAEEDRAVETSVAAAQLSSRALPAVDGEASNRDATDIYSLNMQVSPGQGFPVVALNAPVANSSPLAQYFPSFAAPPEAGKATDVTTDDDDHSETMLALEMGIALAAALEDSLPGTGPVTPETDEATSAANELERPRNLWVPAATSTAAEEATTTPEEVFFASFAMDAEDDTESA